MNYCRICLKEDENDDFINIFEHESDIAGEIFLISSVKVRKRFL
jgi:hypothetical protein